MATRYLLRNHPELDEVVAYLTITEGNDSIIWCDTDFNGNTPQSVPSLYLGLLFRAEVAPTKGRVEIEGLTIILGALKQDKTNRK